MDHSQEKSQFLCQQKDAWDHHAEEARLHGELTEQLAATRLKVGELAPAGEEVASLQIREADARWHANEAKEKFTAWPRGRAWTLRSLSGCERSGTSYS
jgi:hypothetical protein